MAKNKRSRKRAMAAAAGHDVALAGEKPVDESAPRGSDANDEVGKDSRDGRGGGGRVTGSSFSNGSGRGGTAAFSGGGGGFFSVYKPGLGYYTRLGTAIGGGLVLFFGAHYINSRLTSFSPAVQLGIPAVILAITGGLLFRIVGSGRKTNDFFIATEGEMKKVSWSSKKEVVGSTKVVLMFTVMLAALLFIVDGLFMAFFGIIGVLKGDILKTIIGL